MFTRSFRRIAGVTAALALAGTLSIGVVHANQIFVQQSGTAPAGGDPNVLTHLGAFTIGVAGNSTLLNPLLVIVGVYDGVGTPSISATCTPSCTTVVAPVGTYGLGHNSATLSSGQSVWGQLGLPEHGVTSESFTNWSAYDHGTLGLPTPTRFSLYAFAIDTSLSSSTPIMLSESGATNGSFILGFGCDQVTASGSCPQGNIAQSVFTNTGVVDTSVPEPGTLAMFGAALLGCTLFIGRRRRDRRS